MAKSAVVLFNLGGPDSPEAVEPFLFNLFRDPAIITLPNPLRWLIAKLISSRRAATAREIYQKIGGSSPLLANTKAQAQALETELGSDYRVFIAMRYWHPLNTETAKAVKDWGAERVFLLPLYPQYSTTTTASSFRSWGEAAGSVGLTVETRSLCCFPSNRNFVQAMSRSLKDALEQRENSPVRVLFSAHGLPEKIVAAGDPYQWQVEASVAAVREELNHSSLDSVVCYQSRVGPLKWIGPSTEEEIHRAGRDGKGLIVVPIAFVSEHSETLVELDMDYRDLAAKEGVPFYDRLPTVGTEEGFIAGLADLVRGLAEIRAPLTSEEGPRLCPGSFGGCAFGKG